MKTGIEEGLSEYKLTGEQEQSLLFALDSVKDSVEEQAIILKDMGIGKYLVVNQIDVNRDKYNQRIFEDHINLLKQQGLDIGKGNTQYGFRMPLPQKDELYRKLIIFRRR